MMRELVLGLEVVLADGTILTSLNKMLKNNAGYDLKQLFIGAEGTLGVVTRAVLRIWPRPLSVSTALLAIENFDQVAGLLSFAKSAFGGLLTSYEVMWNDYYRLVTTPPGPHRAPLGKEFAYYVLMETMGADVLADQERFENLLSSASDRGLFSDAVIPRSNEQRAALWRIREDTEQISVQYKPDFGFDVSLPLPVMQRYVDETRSALSSAFGEIKFWVYGHVGDGNLHLNVWGRTLDAADHAAVAEVIYRPLAELGGSISAEHGIGLDKKPYLHLSRSAEEIAVMRRIKQALDPKGILNPGKVFDL